MDKLMTYKRGNAWVGLLVMLVFMITIGLTLLTSAINSIAQSKKAAQTLLAQSLADGGVDRAIARLNQTGGLYGGETDFIVSNSGTIDIEITSGANPILKNVLVKSYVPRKISVDQRPTRQVRAVVTSEPNGDNISFHYAVQIGDGGLDMNPNSEITGTVFSNGSITGSGSIDGDTWTAKTLTGVTVTGAIRQGVPPEPMPSINVEAWKSEANRNNDAITGAYSKTSGTLGPKRINGNCSFSNIMITGPIYCTGSLQISGTISISPTFSSNGTVVMADGIITNSGATVKDTGATPKGYILFITNSTDNNAALTLSNWSTGGVFLAVNGGVSINPHTHPVIVSANRFNMQPNSDLVCDSGLGSASFVNGPGGSWRPIEWQIVY